jgi:hypothetical protein
MSTADSCVHFPVHMHFLIFLVIMYSKHKGWCTNDFAALGYACAPPATPPADPTCSRGSGTLPGPEITVLGR